MARLKLKDRLRRTFENAIKPLVGAGGVKVTTSPDGALDLTYDKNGKFLRARFEETGSDSCTLHLAGEIDGGRFEAKWDLTVADLDDVKGLTELIRSAFAENGRAPATAAGRRPSRSVGRDNRRRSVGQPYPAYGKGESVHLGNAQAGVQVRVPFAFEIEMRGRPKRVNANATGVIENVDPDARPPSLPIWVHFPRSGVRASFAEDELEFLAEPAREPRRQRRVRPPAPPERVWDEPENYPMEPEYETPHFMEEEYEEFEGAMGGEVFGRRQRARQRQTGGRFPRGRPVPGRRPRRY